MSKCQTRWPRAFQTSQLDRARTHAGAHAHTHTHRAWAQHVWEVSSHSPAHPSPASLSVCFCLCKWLHHPPTHTAGTQIFPLTSLMTHLVISLWNNAFLLSALHGLIRISPFLLRCLQGSLSDRFAGCPTLSSSHALLLPLIAPFSWTFPHFLILLLLISVLKKKLRIQRAKTLSPFLYPKKQCCPVFPAPT